MREKEEEEEEEREAALKNPSNRCPRPLSADRSRKRKKRKGREGRDPLTFDVFLL